MKLKDIKVGMKLKTKKVCVATGVDFVDTKCKVTNVEALDYDGELTVRIEYNNGESQWVNHKNLKLRKKDKLKAQGD